MKQLLWLLFVSLFAGSSLSLEAAQCTSLYRGHTRSFCCNTRSGQTCFTTIFGTNNLPVRKSFEEASPWCNSAVLGSSLIIVNSLESKRTVESFIGIQELENQTILIDAQKLSINESLEWSWVNGHKTIPTDVTTKQSYDGACVESKHGQPLAYCFDKVSSLFRYICEYSDSKSASSYRHNNKYYDVSKRFATWYDARNECLSLGGDLASVTDLQAIEDWSQLKERQAHKYWIGLHRNKWIWNSTGAAITYTNWEGGYPNESSDEQCICIYPQCRTGCNVSDVDRKWRTCNCNNSYAAVCMKEENSDALTTEIDDTSADLTSSVSFPVDTSTKSHNSLESSSSSSTAAAATAASNGNPTNSSNLNTNTARTNSTIRPTPPVITKTSTTFTKTPIATTTTITTTATTKPVISSLATYTSTIAVGEIDTKTISSSSMTEKPSNHFAENETTAFASSTSGLFKSLTTGEILLILLSLVAVVFIVAAVILIIRKRKYDTRNEGLPMTNTKQNETVSSVYATALPVSRPSEGTIPPGNTIYTDVEMTKQPTAPSNNTIYASVQPTSEAIDTGKSVVYAEANIPQKDQQKPSSADKITVSLSPIYSQPYEPPTPASNTEYAEPFKPDKTHTATAPVLSPSPAGDQHNTYSLATPIPLGDPSVIYSEVNKPTQPSTPVDEAVKATDPIYLEAIEVKPGPGSDGVATQDPSAVYAEPIKVKKSP